MLQELQELVLFTYNMLQIIFFEVPSPLEQTGPSTLKHQVVRSFV